MASFNALITLPVRSSPAKTMLLEPRPANAIFLQRFLSQPAPRPKVKTLAVSACAEACYMTAFELFTAPSVSTKILFCFPRELISCAALSGYSNFVPPMFAPKNPISFKASAWNFSVYGNTELYPAPLSGRTIH